MDVAFFVNRVSSHPAQVQVDYAGETVTATLNELEVELSDPSGQHGSLVLRFRKKDEIEAAQSQFTEGSTVRLVI